MDIIFYNPIVNLFLFLYKLFFENFVIAIIFLTLILQLVLWPLSIKQYTAGKKMKDIQDKLKKVQDKRASGKELSVAEMQMASQAFRGMIAGCLPSLIQLPFLLALYNIITKVANSSSGTIFNNIAYTNALKFPDGYHFHLDFFGLNLSKKIQDFSTLNPSSIAILVVLIAVTIVMQYISIRVSSPNLALSSKVQKIDATAKPKKGKKAEAEEVAEEINDTTQQSMRIFTVVIAVFSILLPAALSIYWLARSIFVIILTKIQLKYIIKDK